MKRLILSLLLMFLIILPVSAIELRYAKVTYIDGKIEVKRKSSPEWVKAVLNMKLKSGDKISASFGSSGELTLFDGSKIRLEENTIMDISQLMSRTKGSKQAKMKIWIGKINLNVTKLKTSDDEFSVQTPTLVCGVRGTEFDVEVRKDGSTNVGVDNGEVAIKSDKGEQTLTKGQAASVDKSGNIGEKKERKIKEQDNEAPVIDHSPVNEVDEGKEIKIEANVTDNKKVKKVILRYKKKGGSYVQVPLKDSGNGKYESVIPWAGISGSDQLAYYISASDGKNNVSLSPVSVKVNLKENVKKKLEPPVISSPSGDMEVNEDMITVNGSGEPNAEIEFEAAGASMKKNVSADGFWEFTGVKLKNKKNNVIRARVTDKETGKKSGWAKINIRVKKIDLVLSIDYPYDGAIITNKQITSSGSGNGKKISVSAGGSAKVKDDGSWEIKGIHLKDGENALIYTMSSKKESIKRSIKVIYDAEAPVITLNGSSEVKLKVNGKYTEMGGRASDNVDGDITSKISISGEVDVKTPGEYEITYNVKDSAGNNADEVKRVVIVEAAPIKRGSIKVSVTRGPAPSVNCKKLVPADYSNKLDMELNWSLSYTNKVTVDVQGSGWQAGNGSEDIELSINNEVYTVKASGGSFSKKADIEINLMDYMKAEAGDYGDVAIAGKSFISSVVLSPGKNPSLVPKLIENAVEVNVSAKYANLSSDAAEGSAKAGERVTSGGAVNMPFADIIPPELTRTELYGDRFTLYLMDNESGIKEGTVKINGKYPVIEGDIWVIYFSEVYTDRTPADEYTLQVEAEDKAGNILKKDVVKSDVIIVDDISPELKVQSENIVIVKKGGEFTYPSVTASDNIDGDITDSIKRAGEVDINTPGNYSVVYSVVDSSNNQAERAIEVIVDGEAPVITLSRNGTELTGELIQIEAGYDVSIVSSAVDDVDGDVTSLVKVSGNSNNLVPAQYLMSYSVSDRAGNESVKTLTVRIVDTTKPVITVTAKDGIEVTDAVQAEASSEQVVTVTASDIVDGDITSEILTTGNLQENVPGEYQVVYQVSDAAGNKQTKNITVTIVDTTKPVIHLTRNGEEAAGSIEIVAGQELGITAAASDIVDGDISANVTVTGAVNTNQAGEYTLTYTVTDAAGNQADKTLNVVVVTEEVAAGNVDISISRVEQPSVNCVKIDAKTYINTTEYSVIWTLTYTNQVKVDITGNGWQDNEQLEIVLSTGDKIEVTTSGGAFSVSHNIDIELANYAALDAGDYGENIEITGKSMTQSLNLSVGTNSGLTPKIVEKALSISLAVNYVAHKSRGITGSAELSQRITTGDALSMPFVDIVDPVIITPVSLEDGMLKIRIMDEDGSGLNATEVYIQSSKASLYDGDIYDGTWEIKASEVLPDLPPMPPGTVKTLAVKIEVEDLAGNKVQQNSIDVIGEDFGLGE